MVTFLNLLSLGPPFHNIALRKVWESVGRFRFKPRLCTLKRDEVHVHKINGKISHTGMAVRSTGRSNAPLNKNGDGRTPYTMWCGEDPTTSTLCFMGVCSSGGQCRLLSGGWVDRAGGGRWSGGSSAGR